MGRRRLNLYPKLCPPSHEHRFQPALARQSQSRHLCHASTTTTSYYYISKTYRSTDFLFHCHGIAQCYVGEGLQPDNVEQIYVYGVHVNFNDSRAFHYTLQTFGDMLTIFFAL